MGSSREQSPDWLHCFQAPTASASALVLSSDSEPSYDGTKEDRTDSEEVSLRKSPKSEDDDENLGKILGGKSRSSKKAVLKSPTKGKKLGDDVSPGKKTPKKSSKKRKGDNDESDKKAATKELNHPLLTLSSDSELSPENSPRREKTSVQIDEAKDVTLIDSDNDSLSKKASKDKRTKKEPEEDIYPLTKEKRKRDVKREGNGSDLEATEKEAPEKQVESHVSSARLPLILSEKVHRTKALVECEGDSIDLGGDMGSVGRVVISDTPSGDHEMFLDLKGTIYKTTIVPSRTFCVVSFGQSEAKIEAIMNDFIQLKPQSNVFEAETMVEGTLEGFSFESDEEGDKAPKGVSHQNNEDGEAKANGKTKGKSEKASGVAKKRAKTVGGKSQPPKKVKKKAPASKKAKSKK